MLLASVGWNMHACVRILEEACMCMVELVVSFSGISELIIELVVKPRPSFA